MYRVVSGGTGAVAQCKQGLRAQIYTHLAQASCRPCSGTPVWTYAVKTTLAVDPWEYRAAPKRGVGDWV